MDNTNTLAAAPAPLSAAPVGGHGQSLQFISLGSGSSGNCYFLSCDGYGLLIDLGIGIRLFKKHCADYGVRIADIHAILLTHDHTDHVKAVGCLSSMFHIPVYTSQKVHNSVQANHFVSKKIPTELRHSVERGTEFGIGPFLIRSFAVPHDSADNNGYIIRAAGETFVLLTDVGHFTDEMPQIVSAATHLVVEANYDESMLAAGRYPERLKRRISGPNGHISNAETARFLAQNLTPGLIRSVWLCHLSAENNTPQRAYDTVSASLAEQGYVLDGEGRNLHLQVLARRTPSLMTDLKAL